MLFYVRLIVIYERIEPRFGQHLHTTTNGCGVELVPPQEVAMPVWCLSRTANPCRVPCMLTDSMAA